MLFAQMTMDEFRDIATTGLPVSPLALVIAAVAIWYFRDKIGAAFVGIYKPTATGETAADSAPPATPAPQPTPVPKVKPGPEFLYKTMIAAGIKPDDAAKFVKEHFDEIMGNAPAASAAAK